MNMIGYPGLSPMGMGMSGFHPAMLGGLRSRHHSSYYHPSYGHGSGRSGARYLDPYDLFDDVFDDDDVFAHDYDDIDDPLMMYFRMQRSGGGRRGRRGRYGRYGGGMGYHGFL